MSQEITRSIRENYDRLAEEYARHLYHELERKPLDRQVLGRFAVQVAGRGEVCDMGCGPGHVTRYLLDLGVEVFGMDISPKMIEVARRRNPNIHFECGDMGALVSESDRLAGIVAFYAIVNMPEERLPLVFREMHRVLRPGGVLLLAFHIGEDILRPETLWGQPVTLEWFFLRTKTVVQLLEAAGFSIQESIERDPYEPDVEHQSRRAYILAHKSLHRLWFSADL